MPKRTSSFRDDLLADLADPREASNYLNAALEDSDEMFLVALRDVAEARQMAKVAESAGIARESVYRMLTVEGNPTYSNLLGILRAVGLKLAIRPEETSGRSRHRGRRALAAVSRRGSECAVAYPRQGRKEHPQREVKQRLEPLPDGRGSPRPKQPRPSGSGRAEDSAPIASSL
jgi:probable addiction module antidote protein